MNLSIQHFPIFTSRQNAITDRKSLISRSFSSLRWILAVLVVINHYVRANYYEFGQDIFDASQSSAAIILDNLISSFTKNYEVPIFVFISGYLVYFGRELSFPAYFHKFRHKLKTLGIPYIIWCLFPVILHFVMHCNKPLNENPFFSGINSIGSLWEFIRHTFGLDLATFPYNVPLWYIRDYFIIFTLLPLIHYLLIKTRGWILILFASIFMLSFSDLASFRTGAAIFFFPTAYWLRLQNIDLLQTFKKIAIPAALIYLALGCTYYLNADPVTNFDSPMPLWVRIAKNTAICASVPAAIYGCASLIRSKVLSGNTFLASASFFLYVTHYPLMNYFLHAGFKIFHCSSQSGPFLTAILTTTAVAILSITMIYRAMTKLAPRLMKIVDGR